ncbi:CHRD domain-containing protein [Geomonas sp. Red69]|uniref:CHRD domain-containing protein n=1 Tax=Geomonas diazotrophica TaxID=2843197 RepID=A0ABX8JHP1_9BACT|nr:MULTISPECIES: CHRD domain-containing protein [Geomonas]MBU5635441.1 CHRD domain-containing protein [Geomonas diazotrophica]QWV97506.1 CHRD domain-containing protein [Geomonas nitrogeniifigens]QXE86646.1 CHRD domain-containing protein [Geomonas nitrogeniifigens]
MRKWQMSVVVLAVLATLPAGAEQRIFRAKLSGQQEAPLVKTPARGDIKMIYAGGEMSYELNVSRITSPVAAHIHHGKPGQNGPPLVGLFGGPVKMGVFKGILAEGLITNENLIGELEGKTVEDLVRIIDAGEAYVDVPTVTYPMGEIRGQIK